MPLKLSDFTNRTAAERRALKLEHLIPTVQGLLPLQWQYAHPTRGNIGVRVFGIGYRDQLLRLDVEAQLMVNGKRLAVASPMYILNPPVLAPGGAGGYEWNPLRAVKTDIEHTVGLMPALKDGEVVDDADPTLTAYPDPDAESSTVDGWLVRQLTGGITWSTARDSATATSVDDSATVGRVAWLMAHGTDSGEYTRLYRAIYGFDTSAVGVSDTISSATFSLRGTNKTVTGWTSSDSGWDLCAVNCTSPVSATALATGDYNKPGTTVHAAIAYGSWSTGAYNDFSVGGAAVNKGGITWLATRLRCDVTNTEPTWIASANLEYQARYADYAGTTDDPKLVVVYTTGSARRVMMIS